MTAAVTHRSSVHCIGVAQAVVCASDSRVRKPLHMQQQILTRGCCAEQRSMWPSHGKRCVVCVCGKRCVCVCGKQTSVCAVCGKSGVCVCAWQAVVYWLLLFAATFAARLLHSLRAAALGAARVIYKGASVCASAQSQVARCRRCRTWVGGVGGVGHDTMTPMTLAVSEVSEVSD